jgi:hypothetical protein
MRVSKRSKQTCLLMVFMLVLTGLSFAANLLKNGDLEGADANEFTAIWKHTFTCYVIEEEDGNRCAKFEVIALEDAGESQRLNGSLLIGGAKGWYGDVGKDALRLRPNTTYEFGFDVKGTIKYFNHATFDVWLKDGSRKNIKTSVNKRVQLTQDWERCEGEFTTDDTIQTAVLKLNVYTDEPKDNPIHKVGDYMLVDNVVIKEKGR